MRGTIITFLFTLMAIPLFSQQEPMFTQFMWNKLAINPAYAGNHDFAEVHATYRNQWLGLEGSPTAINLSANFPTMYKELGLGLTINSRKIGVTSKNAITGMYSYRFPLGNGTMSLGLETSIKRYNVDFADDRIYAIDGIENDEAIPTSAMSKTVFNAGFGFYYNTDKYFFGTSLANLMRADLDFGTEADFSEEVLHLKMMMGREFTVTDYLNITPQFLLRYIGTGVANIDVNVMATVYDDYMAGITYRSGGSQANIGESIDFLVGMHIQDNLLLGLAYDVGVSDLRQYHNGSIELTIGYKFLSGSSNVKMVNPRYF